MQDTRNNELVMLNNQMAKDILSVGKQEPTESEMMSLEEQGEKAGIPKEHQGAVFVKGEVVTIKGMEFVIHEVRSARIILHPKKK